MHYLISHQVKHFSYLHTTPRKKQLKHQLLCLKQGSVLVRLGKHDYLINAPQVLWLPANCLVSVTYLPNTDCMNIDISSRSNLEFPVQAGILKTSTLINACLDKLTNLTFDDTSIKDQTLQALYTLIMDDVTQQIPQLNEGVMTLETINIDTEEYDNLRLCLQVREARKRRLSGESAKKILDSLFQNDLKIANQAFIQATGEAFEA